MKHIPFNLPRGVNTIKRVWQNPCDAPWYVYAEAAKEPAGKFGLGLLSFGLDDVVRGMTRPAGAGRAAGHARPSRRGKKGKRRLKGGIPEVGEMVGSNLLTEDFREPAQSDGLKALWKLDGVIQRGLFYWLLADLTSDFAYEFSTGIIQTEYCRSNLFSAGALEKAHQFQGPLTGWHSFIMSKVYGPWPPFPVPAWQAGVNGGFAVFSASAVADDPFHPGNAAGCRLRGNSNVIDSAIRSTFFTGKADVISSASLRPFEQVVGECAAFGGGHSFDNVSFFGGSF